MRSLETKHEEQRTKNKEQRTKNEARTPLLRASVVASVVWDSLARNSLAYPSAEFRGTEFWQIQLRVVRILANSATGCPNFGKFGYGLPEFWQIRLRGTGNDERGTGNGEPQPGYRPTPKKKLNTRVSSVSALAMGKAKSKANGAGPRAGTLTRRPKPGATRKLSAFRVISSSTVP